MWEISWFTVKCKNIILHFIKMRVMGPLPWEKIIIK